jgi:hypothetical protein
MLSGVLNENGLPGRKNLARNVLTRSKAQILPVAAGSDLELIIQTVCGDQRKVTGMLVPEKYRTVLEPGFLYDDLYEMPACFGWFLVQGHRLGKALDQGQKLAHFITLPLCAKEAHLHHFINQVVHPSSLFIHLCNLPFPLN